VIKLEVKLDERRFEMATLKLGWGRKGHEAVVHITQTQSDDCQSKLKPLQHPFPGITLAIVYG
jgi:hypothetical protein